MYNDGYLSASSPRKLTAGGPNSINKRASTSSLRRSPSSLARNLHDDDDGGMPPQSASRFSLAHELAVALMPEPSAGSKLLAEEFGIEYDEGAEGIDDDGVDDVSNGRQRDPSIAEEDETEMNGGRQLGRGMEVDGSTGFGEGHGNEPLGYHGVDPAFGGPEFDEPGGNGGSMMESVEEEVEQDSMKVLADNLELTDNFLSHLRRLDTTGDGPSSHSSSSNPHHHQLPLEKLATDMIRHMEETTRDRESQLRELIEYEREFRRIGGEVGGGDVLAVLDELEGLEKIVSDSASAPSLASHIRQDSYSSPPASPTLHTSASAPNPGSSSRVPQLSSLRTSTSSLLSSLSVISEHAQVNGAATADAGRKIRALKNKIGGWRTDWDLAERSREKIEKWESGQLDEGDGDDGKSQGIPRMNGRQIVEVQLREFERALADAALKTQAIAASA